MSIEVPTKASFDALVKQVVDAMTRISALESAIPTANLPQNVKDALQVILTYIGSL